MARVERSADTPRRARGIGRHPAVIGAAEGARALLVLVPAALALSTLAWFIGIAEQRPLSAITAWAATGLGVVHGLGGRTETHVHLLPPTALTLAVWLLVHHAARRTRHALDVDAALGAPAATGAARPRIVAGIALGGVLGLGILVPALVLGDIAPGVLGLLRTVLVLGTAIGVGLGRHAIADAVRDGMRSEGGPRWEAALGSGHAAFRRAGLGLLVVGALAVLAALAFGWDRAAAVVGLYSDPTAAGIGLAVVQLLFAPTVLVLGLSWVSGAGIMLADGALASPFTAVEVPLPGFPLLAVVPQDPPAWAVVAPLAVLLCGLVAVIGRPAWHVTDLRAVLVLVVEIAVCALLVGLFATGAIGPGGLAEFGVRPLLLAGALAAGTGCGALIGWGMLRLAGRPGPDDRS